MPCFASTSERVAKARPVTRSTCAVALGASKNDVRKTTEAADARCIISNLPQLSSRAAQTERGLANGVTTFASRTARPSDRHLASTAVFAACHECTANGLGEVPQRLRCFGMTALVRSHPAPTCTRYPHRLPAQPRHRRAGVAAMGGKTRNSATTAVIPSRKDGEGPRKRGNDVRVANSAAVRSASRMNCGVRLPYECAPNSFGEVPQRLRCFGMTRWCAPDVPAPNCTRNRYRLRPRWRHGRAGVAGIAVRAGTAQPQLSSRAAQTERDLTDADCITLEPDDAALSDSGSLAAPLRFPRDDTRDVTG